MSGSAHPVARGQRPVHNVATAATVDGAQVVGRIAAVLRAVSAAMPGGLTTAEAAAATGLARSTAHRLLTALVADGFLDREADDGRWCLGPELYLMGTVAAERYDVTGVARAAVRSLAAATGESAFFSARRGDETVCLLREEGSFPIRSFVLYEGIRFPLGVASAGLALLAHLPGAEVDRYLDGRGDALADQFGAAHTADAIRRRIAMTRRVGYAVNPGLIVEGSWGMGAAVFDRTGAPAWALSLTGIEPRFSASRRPELGRLLLEHAHAVGARLAQRH
ncbi:IclR family transcriptional regulator [Cellulomonas sp. NTE-D12]|uniref:IclR family transcriptional regulator n=1 Tax=Cellulomonas sp. NTE-D12 TaxID=2962632 RepID=UPI003081E7F1|nr:putative IclR-family regulatory protein [Cellulomonas sp. NTE-D12]